MALASSSTPDAEKSSPPSFIRRISLAQWLLIAAALGIAVGLMDPSDKVVEWLKLPSDIFLRLIRAIIAPVLFGVLVRAVGNAGAIRDLGRIGVKSVICFEVLTTLALLLGWITALVVKPGEGITLPAQGAPVANAVSFFTVLLNAFPTSIVDAMARGDVLQIVVFCLIFGGACLVLGDPAKPVLAFAESVAQVAFRFTNLIMVIAPFAVFGAMASTVAGGGGSVLKGLFRLIVASWFAELFFLIVILGGALVLFRIPVRRFIRYVREPFLVAFATTSSAAALPQTLTNMERFGVPQKTLGFVAPLSLSLNLNGSTIFIGLATLFVAQAAGIKLSLDQQILIFLTLKLTSKGVAGIPRANFVVLTALFQSYGLPMSGLAMLLGVDALIDPIRTSVNVVGHSVAPAVIARWDGVKFPDKDSDA